MNILMLNCWGGREFASLMEFVEKYEKEIDVWCLQEVPMGTEDQQSDGIRHNLLKEFLKRLSGVSVFTYPSPINEFRGNRLKYGTNVGMAMLVSPKIKSESVACKQLYDSQSEHATVSPRRTGTGHLLAVKVVVENCALFIGNVHGLWTPCGKGDVPDRLAQSFLLARIVKQQGIPAILAGDFNMELNCQSARILEDVPMRNLVREYRIKTTRTSFYNGEYPHADNAFVTTSVRVNGFQVLSDEVSDHAALLLEVEV